MAVLLNVVLELVGPPNGLCPLQRSKVQFGRDADGPITHVDGPKARVPAHGN